MVDYVVTGPLPEEAMAALPPGGRWQTPGPIPMERDDLLTRMGTARGLLCFLVDLIDLELLDAAPALEAISQVSVGVDNIDVAACTARGIPVGHTPDVLTETTADTALALLLAVIRRLPEGQALVREGRWGRWSLDLLTGSDLHHSTVGIVGLGRIGLAVASRLSGFSCRLLYTGPRRRPHLEAEWRIGFRSLEELLTESDHVILAAPLNEETRSLIDRRALALMKPTATLINIARGGLVDTAALAEALQSGIIARAGLDVTDPEPLPADHPLVALPNCLIIPHLGSASESTRAQMATRAAFNLAAGLEGRRMSWCVNPEVYDQVGD
ncbi:MAG: 2-hydroxyacid dehydrogenase [Actinomycetota bacterium]